MTPDNPPSAPSANSLTDTPEIKTALSVNAPGSLIPTVQLRAMVEALSSRPSPTVERREEVARQISQMIVAQLMLFDEFGETSPSTDAEVEHLSETIVREFLAQPATGAVEGEEDNGS